VCSREALLRNVRVLARIMQAVCATQNDRSMQEINLLQRRNLKLRAGVDSEIVKIPALSSGSPQETNRLSRSDTSDRTVDSRVYCATRTTSGDSYEFSF
jgi:Tfp pilus assembly protein PilW